MQQFNPDDFKLKPLQIILYFIVCGGLMFLLLKNGFTLLGASLMALGIMVILILLDYLVIGYLEKRQKEKEDEE